MSTDTRTATDVDETEDGSTAMWVVAVLGLWVLVTPFFWGQLNASGFWNFSGGWLYWSNIVTGIVITALAAYAGYE